MTSPLAIAFQNEHLSVSRLKLYEQCALAFHYRYIDKGPTEPRGNAADFGIVLHAALEEAYAWVVANEHDGPFPVEELLGAYRRAWTASALVGVELFQEGLVLLRRYAASHSPVSHWDILAIEKEFNIEIVRGADRYVVNGYLDRVDRIADDHVAIVDYKSNRLLFYSDELENDLQMSVYGLVARELWPWAKRVSFVFHMLRHDVHQGATRTAAQLDDAGSYVVALGKRTEDPRQDWAPTLNPNCGYCDHRRRCPAYQEALAGGHEIAKVADPTDFAEVGAKREALHVLAKLAYARKSELDKLLLARLQHEGEFEVGGWRYRTINQADTAYALPSVVRVFGEVGIPEAEVRARVLQVDKGAVDALHAEVAEKLGRAKATILQASLEAIAVRTPKSPRLDAHKLKTAKDQAAADVAHEAKEAEKARGRGKKGKEASP